MDNNTHENINIDTLTVPTAAADAAADETVSDNTAAPTEPDNSEKDVPATDNATGASVDILPIDDYNTDPSEKIATREELEALHADFEKRLNTIVENLKKDYDAKAFEYKARNILINNKLPDTLFDYLKVDNEESLNTVITEINQIINVRTGLDIKERLKGTGAPRCGNLPNINSKKREPWGLN